MDHSHENCCKIWLKDSIIGIYIQSYIDTNTWDMLAHIHMAYTTHTVFLCHRQYTHTRIHPHTHTLTHTHHTHTHKSTVSFCSTGRRFESNSIFHICMPMLCSHCTVDHVHYCCSRVSLDTTDLSWSRECTNTRKNMGLTKLSSCSLIMSPTHSVIIGQIYCALQ